MDIVNSMSGDNTSSQQELPVKLSKCPISVDHTSDFAFSLKNTTVYRKKLVIMAVFLVVDLV